MKLLTANSSELLEVLRAWKVPLDNLQSFTLRASVGSFVTVEANYAIPVQVDDFVKSIPVLQKYALHEI